MTAGSLEAETSGGWLLSVDGASNQTGSNVGVILESPNGVLIEQSLHFEFKANNSQAEYEALLVGTRLAKELEAKVLTTKSNLKLMTGQGPPIGKVLGQNHQAGDNLLEIYPPPCTQGVEREGRLIFKTRHLPEERSAKVNHSQEHRSTNYQGARSRLHRGTDNMDESPDGVLKGRNKTRRPSKGQKID
ncbi:hypothetical protein CR513_32731, partial [Mucuna pruriens]